MPIFLSLLLLVGFSLDVSLITKNFQFNDSRATQFP